jgi:hypothetical protein
MVALVLLVFLKALERFILEPINEFHFTIQLSDPVFDSHHTTHSGVPLPRGCYTVCTLRQFRIDFDSNVMKKLNGV